MNANVLTDTDVGIAIHYDGEYSGAVADIEWGSSALATCNVGDSNTVGSVCKTVDSVDCMWINKASFDESLGGMPISINIGSWGVSPDIFTTN